MANLGDISKIQLPNGDVVNVKDAFITDIVSQTYNSADCNISLFLCQDNGVTGPSTYYMTDQSKMHFQIEWIKNQYKYWNDSVDSYKYRINTLGLIATNNAAKRMELTLSTPQVTNETYVKISSDADEKVKTAGTYVWQKSSANVGDVWYIRPHLEYTDLETGMEYTMYGPVYKVTVGVPCTIECATLSCTELTSMLGDIDSIPSSSGLLTSFHSKPMRDKIKSWTTKTWSGLPSVVVGKYFWTDGNNIYYSASTDQYVFNKSTSTWATKTWSGLTKFFGERIWTDGENIYYSFDTDQYVLNKSTSTWATKTWKGLSSLNGIYVWTDGENIYYSYGSDQYVLNKSTSTWSITSWTGLTSFDGRCVWTDGENIYYSYDADQYVLNESTSTWSTKTWSGLTTLEGNNVWTDGENIYYSSSIDQYVLNKSTSTWSTKTWSGFTRLDGRYIWTDGENIYYSFGPNQYVLTKTPTTYLSPALTPSLQG